MRWVYLAQTEDPDTGTWTTAVAADTEAHGMESALEILRLSVKHEIPGRVRLGKVPMDDQEAEPDVLWIGG